MDYEQFVDQVAQALGAGRETAEQATQATLGVLGERVGKDECTHLVAQLPPELGGWLFSADGAQGFDALEFLRRVAEREQADVATAERHARATFLALARALPADAYSHLLTRLSKDYAPLLPKGPYAGAVGLDEFLATVARHADVDVDRARRAAGAVLEAIAERIAPGEVDELMSQLPIALHEPLKRGRDRADERSRRMPVGEFITRVSERALVPPQGARVLTRAVLQALRESVRTEFFDVTVQLPNEYWELLEHAH
jgi:uncharacterized protein (DUF2267 family)